MAFRSLGLRAPSCFVHATVFTLALLGAARAHADVPPPPNIKGVDFDLRVTRLERAPGRVMIAYPFDHRGGVAQVNEGVPLSPHRRSAQPRLYLVPATAFETWRAKHPAETTFERDDKRVVELLATPGTATCNDVVRMGFELPRLHPDGAVRQTLELVKASATKCVLRETERTDTHLTEQESLVTALKSPPGRWSREWRNHWEHWRAQMLKTLPPGIDVDDVVVEDAGAADAGVAHAAVADAGADDAGVADAAAGARAGTGGCGACSAAGATVSGGVEALAAALLLLFRARRRRVSASARGTCK